MFHVHWNVWSIMGGIVFFDEFQSFTAINYALFLLGVTCILVGVAYLSQREMQNQTHVGEGPHISIFVDHVMSPDLKIYFSSFFSHSQ
jgi:hypothetical protein